MTTCTCLYPLHLLPLLASRHEWQKYAPSGCKADKQVQVDLKCTDEQAKKGENRNPMVSKGMSRCEGCEKAKTRVLV